MDIADSGGCAAEAATSGRAGADAPPQEVMQQKLAPRELDCVQNQTRRLG